MFLKDVISSLMTLKLRTLNFYFYFYFEALIVIFHHFPKRLKKVPFDLIPFEQAQAITQLLVMNGNL